MESLSIEEQHRLQKELLSGEHVLWAGKPNRRIVFHRSDLGMIPFSLFWAGFSIFWELGVSGHGFAPDRKSVSLHGRLGNPVHFYRSVSGLGTVPLRHVEKTRILYALTNERLLVIVGPPQAKFISGYLRAVPGIEKEMRSDGIGTLKFGDIPPLWAAGRRRETAAVDGLYLNSGTPVFVDIDAADDVANRISTQIRRLQNG